MTEANEDKPFFSVVMPCFNAESYIGQAISSVRDQDYFSWELIIVDDASTDSSLEIARRYSCADARIKIFENCCDKGAAGARKTAIKNCSGSFIAFLDSDDYWGPSYLNFSHNFLKKNPSITCIFSNYVAFKGQLNTRYSLPLSVGYKQLLMSNFIPCLTAIVRSDLLDWSQMPIIKSRNDYAIWLQLTLLKSEVFFNARFCQAFYRVSNEGLSGSRLDSICFGFRVLRDYGQVRLSFGLMLITLQILMALIKKKIPLVFNRLCASRMLRKHDIRINYD